MPCEMIQLHVHSRLSFKDGLSPIEDLAARAAELGQPGLGLTDHGVLYGAPMHFNACKDHGLKGVIGMEAYEAVPHKFDMERDGDIFSVKWTDLKPDQDRYYHLTLWVLNLTGWQNLCSLHSQSFTENYLATQRGKPLVDRASLEKYNEGLAVGLGCPASRTNVTLSRHGEQQAYEAAKWYAEVFQGRCYVECMGVLAEQQAMLRPQRALGKKLGVPRLAVNDVHYVHQEEGAENGPHHILVQARAFRSSTTEKATDKSDDGFGSWYGSDGFYLKSGEDMLASGMLPDEVEQTVALLDRVDFDFLGMEKPKPPIAAVPQPGDDTTFDAWLAARGSEVVT